MKQKSNGRLSEVYLKSLDYDEMRSLLKRKGRLTPAEAAIFIGFGRSTMERWKKEGKGPLFYQNNDHVWYLAKDLIAWEESCLKHPGEEVVVA